MESFKDSSCMLNEETPLSLHVARDSSKDYGRTVNFREHRRPMWTQHEKTVLRLLMREYAGVTEFDPPDVHKHPIKNEMWQLLTSRYNDHPNVRTRDTKQLRKAWENLKYRARKMGSELKKSSSTVGRKSNASQVCSDTSWPLDGVSFNISDDKNYENQEILSKDDSKIAIMDNGFLEYIPKEDSKSTVVENGFAEYPLLKEPSGVSVLTGSNRDKSHSFGSFFKTTLTGTSESIKNYLDSFSNEREKAIINLQPLVSSIFGGALLPFLSPLPSSTFNSEIFLNYPFNRSCATPAEDSGSEASCTKEDSNFRPCSTRPPSSPDPWPSNFSNNAESSVPKPEGDKQNQSYQETAKNQEYSTPPPDSLDSIGSETPEFAIFKLLHQKTSEEQRHALSVQLLKMQIAHAEVEHELKMKILQTQLEYWQAKVKIQNEEYKISEDT